MLLKPVACKLHTAHGGVAQLGEHLPCKQGVSGSIPLVSTNCSLKTAQKKKSKVFFLSKVILRRET